MVLNDILSKIESVEFSNELNVVSSERAFFRAVRRDPVFKELYKAIIENSGAKEDVLFRIYELSSLNIDQQYENPYDVALAVLLLALGTTELNAGEAARRVSRAPQCWYASKLAHRILAAQSPKSGNEMIAIDKEHSFPLFRTSESDTKDVTLSIGTPSRDYIARRVTFAGSPTHSTKPIVSAGSQVPAKTPATRTRNETDHLTIGESH